MLTIFGYIMTIVGSYMVVERNSHDQINDLGRRVAVLEAQVAWLRAGEDRRGGK